MAMEGKESLIYIDDLTGLLNRRYLYSQLPKELQIAQTQKYNLWLFMLDLDNFKMINDSYGHLCGDEILKDIASLLQENTKSEDKKIRYAGDELTVILPKVEAKDLLNVAQRLVAKIDAYHFKEKRSDKQIHLTISMGIAGYPQDSSDATELINLADKALYISKQKGKNCISTASEITPDLFWKKDILERFPCPVSIGREHELSILRDALNETVKSKCSMFLISGELGVGKSRILNEFERLNLSQQVIYLAARCVDKFVTQPYFTLGEALDRYLFDLDKFPHEFLVGIPEPELTTLFKFLPILKDIPGAPPIKDDATEEKSSLSSGLIKLLINISKSKPLCLLFDDLHYTDAQTLGIILNLIHEYKESPILVISTFCPDELAIPGIGESPLASVIKTEIFQKFAQALNLTGLTPEGVKEMIANLLVDIPLTAEFPDMIYRITRGNPLFVEQLLKYLIEKEFIFYQSGKWIQKEIDETTLPLSIEETIQARIEDLSIETKEMIAKAAVIGEDFQIDLLQKIDSEDRGYILDLMESAKKIGLIYERGTGGRDEFSFVTNEIRKILFKTIGGERTKHLYSRLGEIKEKLYPDKLDTIAGELYYNFKKAEDFVRAEHYVKIVKEGKNVFYDRTMKYAQSLLEEAAQAKILQPLSKKTWLVIPELIRCIYIASVNHILYPPQNKMRIQSVEEIYKRLQKVFYEVNILNIACIESAIVVNNRKLGKELVLFFVNAFISLLRNLNIESITFRKGLRREELSAFIETISNTEKKEETVTELMRRAELEHIQINEITYGAPKKRTKEKESLEEVMLIDYLLGKLPFDEKKADLSSPLSSRPEEIMDSLEKLGEQVSKESGRDKESVKAEIMAKSIQKIGEKFAEKGSDSWRKYKEGLAKTLLSMEPNLRANILASQTEGDKEKADILKELSLELPDEVTVDVLTRQYLQKDNNIEKMRKLLQRFLSTPEKKEKLTPILKEKFKKMGASDEECDCIFEDEPWSALSAQEKANKVLSLPMKTFVNILPTIRIGHLIKELLSQGQEVLVDALLERLFVALEEKHLDSQHLVSYFKEVLDILIQSSPDVLLPKFIKTLLKVCLNKDEFLIFFISVVSPTLEQITQIFLDEERLSLIKGIMHIYAGVKITGEYSKVLEPVTTKLVEELIKRIDFGLDWTELAEIAILLREQAARLLIEEALFEEGVPEGKYFEAYFRRRVIGKILEQIPKMSFSSLIEEKCSDPRLYVIKNLIELISAIEDEDTIRILGVTLKHPEVAIRKKTIFALRKRKGENSARLLGEALRDTDANIRKEALRILKDRHDDFAVGVLKESAQDKDLPADIREAL